MSDDDRWRRSEQADRGPSTPDTLRFDPFATGLGVFFAVAIPIVVVGWTRPSGVSATIVAIGVLIGLVAALAVGLWLSERDGVVWRGRQL